MLTAFAHPKIYNKYVCLLHINSLTPPKIFNNPKLYPFFHHAIGAIDGIHISCCSSASEWDSSCNQKGFVLPNCLIACSFPLQFTYVLSSWKRSAADSTIYHNACHTDLTIPPDWYYLADAGFLSCLELLVPYQGQQYHLAE